MNPFDLHGFAFLTFYLILGIALILVLRWWMNQDHDDDRLGAAAREMAQDPYSIAFLRGGAREAAKIVTIALVDRGLLQLDAKGKELQADKEALLIVRRPIERAVLTGYLVPQSVARLPTALVHTSCKEYERDFLRQGLMPDANALLQRWLLTLAICFCLSGVAAFKVHIALEQGRHNIGFLIMLAVLFILLTTWMAFRRTSGRGKALLDDLRMLFRRLKDRSDAITPGGATNEAILLAAVFGIQALSAANFPFVSQLYPAPKGGDGSGSSCGSGGSCGGGCGGGGCGG